MANDSHDRGLQSKQGGEDQKKSLRRSWKSSGPVARTAVVFAGVAAAATCLYAGVAIWQLRVMSGQLDEMRRDRRPWITAKDARVTLMEVDKPIQGEMTLTNSGRSPALEVRVLGTIYVTNNLVEDIPEMDPIADGDITDGIVGPNMEIHLAVHTKVSVNAQELQLAKQPNTRFYFYGNLMYRDSSQSKLLHRSQFCYYIQPGQNGVAGCSNKRYKNVTD
jgi:hypothetical protein